MSDAIEVGPAGGNRNGVEVSVQVQFVPEQSGGRLGRFVFAYTILIVNHRERPVRLLDRRWTITDGAGEAREVEGDGVIGEQPTIEPGQGFRYSSFAGIEAQPGTMLGSYGMIDENGERFRVTIPAFALRIPEAGGRRLN